MSVQVAALMGLCFQFLWQCEVEVH